MHVFDTWRKQSNDDNQLPRSAAVMYVCHLIKLCLILTWMITMLLIEGLEAR
jgi:hypothetical protein